ncbi:MAG: UDP-N-acetylglucosamine 2-epimerase, partial [Bacteroidota bacterium]
MLVDIIAGARPNFMKISPIIRSIKEAQTKGKNINFRLIHTGQHYDKNMSDNFFEQLQIPAPHYNLNVGSGSQAQQTAGIMIKYEEILEKEKSDLCLVVGDVNSTMACSIVAKKMNIKVA